MRGETFTSRMSKLIAELHLPHPFISTRSFPCHFLHCGQRLYPSSPKRWAANPSLETFHPSMWITMQHTAVSNRDDWHLDARECPWQLLHNILITDCCWKMWLMELLLLMRKDAGVWWCCNLGQQQVEDFEIMWWENSMWRFNSTPICLNITKQQ